MKYGTSIQHDVSCTEPNTYPRHYRPKHNSTENFDEGMTHASLEPLPMLETIENFCLQTDLAARVHGIVKNDDGKNRCDRKFHGIESRLLPHDEEEGCDKRGIRTWECTRVKEGIATNT